jgi:hypothetical protein
MQPGRAALSVIFASISAMRAAPAGAERTFTAPDQQPLRRIGADVMIGFLDTPPLGSTTLVAVEPHAALTITDRAELALRIPLVFGSGDESATTLGNITLATRYLIRLGAGDDTGRRQLIDFGLGLSLATASDGGNSRAVADTQAVLRVPDPGLYLAKATTGRFHLGYGLHGDRVLATARAGVQLLALSASDDGAAGPLGDENLVRTVLSLGAGLRLVSGFWLLTELDLVATLLEGDSPERFYASGAAGARYRTATGLGVGAHVFFPFDSALRDAGALGIGLDVDTRF